MATSTSEEKKEVLNQDQDGGSSCIDTKGIDDNKCIDDKCKGMEYDNMVASSKVQELNHEKEETKSKDVEMIERVEDSKVKGKEYLCSQELRKQKFHFQKKRSSGSTLVISKSDYSRLAQGRTLQHYNPNSGIVMSIRIKRSSQETPKQTSEDQPYQSPLFPPNDKLGLIPKKNSNTLSTDGPVTQNLPTENLPSSLEFTMREHTSADAPMIQDKLPVEQPLSRSEVVMKEQITDFAPTGQVCSSNVISLEASHICFRSIITGIRSPPKKAKLCAPNKGVKKERRVIHPKPSCVLSNHVIHSRFKVATSFKHSDYHLPSSQIFTGYQDCRKRKSSSFQSPDLFQRPRKFIIIINDACNSFSISASSSHMQVDSFSGCMNCVRI